jgi:hypothetical protein
MHDHHTIIEGVDYEHMGPEHHSYLESHCAEFPDEDICMHTTGGRRTHHVVEKATHHPHVTETVTTHGHEDREVLQEELEDEIEDRED